MELLNNSVAAAAEKLCKLTDWLMSNGIGIMLEADASRYKFYKAPKGYGRSTQVAYMSYSTINKWPLEVIVTYLKDNLFIENSPQLNTSKPSINRPNPWHF